MFKKRPKKMVPAEPNPDPQLKQLLDIDLSERSAPLSYDDRAVRDLVRRNPGSAAARYEFKHTLRGYVMQYPLFRAVALGASIEVVRIFVAACPAALSCTGTNSIGGTPLHAACAYDAPADLVRLLVEKCPVALGLKTRYGYTPLHNACEYGASDEVVELVASLRPGALAERTKLGETPADIAERRGRDPEVLAALAAIQLEERGAQSLSVGGGGRSNRWSKIFFKKSRCSFSTAETARSSVC